MKEIWTIHNKKFDYEAVAQRLNIHPAVVRVMRNRGLETEAEMRKFLGLSPFSGYNAGLMKDLPKAAKMLHSIFQAGQNTPQHLRIVGDYDVDGITSTYILYTGLNTIIREKGFSVTVDYEIPDRITDGYGVNERIIEDAKKDGVNVILTCDNGIAAIPAISLAKSYGMTVIVTDHHGIPDTLPPADAIVNPHQADCQYPFKDLCGAAVAFKLLAYMLHGYSLDSYIEHYAPYLAMATVCDVMPLMDENRYLVQHGLAVLKQQMLSCKVDTGLNALLSANQVTPESLDSFTFGFVIGPCLNASGRLHTAKLGLSLLLEQDVQNAAKLAGETTELNNVRKELCKKFEESACQLAFSEEYLKDTVIVMLLEDCHESIAGIVAGRVREATGKPTLILTSSAKEPGIAKGSGRSIPEYHMFNKLTEVKDLFLGFGGHPLAAGFSLKMENVDKLRKALNEKSGLSERDVAIKRKIDAVLPPEQVSFQLLDDMAKLKPYGSANEKPVLAMQHVSLTGLRIVGKNKNVLQMQMMTESGKKIKGVYFNSNPLSIFSFLEEQSGLKIEDIMQSGQPFSIPIGIIYFPKVNEWNGTRSIDYTIIAVTWMGQK